MIIRPDQEKIKNNLGVLRALAVQEYLQLNRPLFCY
jgi:hypothetical protein